MDVQGDSLGTLRRLQVIFRHGIRTPLTLFWGHDDFKERGLLTQEGKNQMTDLGSFLRTRYNEFLGDFADSLTTYAANSSRCRESASLVLKKMFPSKLLEIATMTPEMTGPMIADFHNYFNVWPKTLPRIKDYNLNKVQQYVSINSELDMFKVADQLVTELGQNRPTPIIQPTWVEENKTDLIQFHEAFFSSLLLNGSKEMVDENSGPMLGNLLRQFNVSDPQYSEHGRTTLYCWSDITMATLLTRLGVFDGRPVPFGAAILFELHEIDNASVVRLFYDNTADHPLTQLHVPRDCQRDCPFQSFAEITQKVPHSFGI